MNKSVRIEAIVNDTQEMLEQAVAAGPDFEMLELILDSLPLATEEYARCRNHLHNAWRYYRMQQTGAGEYELTMLLRRLKRLGE